MLMSMFFVYCSALFKDWSRQLPPTSNVTYSGVHVNSEVCLIFLTITCLHKPAEFLLHSSQNSSKFFKLYSRSHCVTELSSFVGMLPSSAESEQCSIALKLGFSNLLDAGPILELDSFTEAQGFSLFCFS